MEHFYRTRKTVVCVLFILALCLMAWATDTRAEYVNLKGGDVMAEPTACKHNRKIYLCVFVLKDKKEYVVLLDKHGEAYMYKVVDGKGILIWTRDTI